MDPRDQALGQALVELEQEVMAREPLSASEVLSSISPAETESLGLPRAPSLTPHLSPLQQPLRCS